jgi:hypothetical protein
MLLPYTSPREIDYLARVIADPFAPTCDRWARRYWETQCRRHRSKDAPFRWPRCVRRWLWPWRVMTGEPVRRMGAVGEGR